MKYLYILLFLFATNISFGQNYVVYTPTVNATNNFYSKVYTKFMCNSNASTMGHSYAIDFNNMTLNLTSCYWGPGPLAVITTIKDTINVGILPAGNYTLNYTAFVTANTSSCVPYDTIINTYTFYAGPNSLNEINKDGGFQISPNPVNDYLKITQLDNNILLKKVVVTNIVGEKVFEIKDDIVNNIDFSFLPKGVYLLSLYTDENYFVKKIIKE